MRGRNRFAIVGLATIFTALSMSCVIDSRTPGLHPGASEATESCTAKLPDGVQDVIRRMQPLWNIVRLADLRGDARRLWMAKRPTDCPGVVTGQFFERGQDAQAILFYSTRKSSALERLVVVQIANGRAESQTADEWRREPGEPVTVVWKLGPGKYTSGDGSKKIQITRDAIALELIPEGVILYYWSGGRFQNLTLTE